MSYHASSEDDTAEIMRIKYWICFFHLAECKSDEDDDERSDDWKWKLCSFKDVIMHRAWFYVVEPRKAMDVNEDGPLYLNKMLKAVTIIIIYYFARSWSRQMQPNEASIFVWSTYLKVLLFLVNQKITLNWSSRAEIKKFQDNVAWRGSRQHHYCS